MKTASDKKVIQSFDNRIQNNSILVEVNEVILDVIREGQFILSKRVTEFEKIMAKLCGVKYATGVANGSDALELSLLACNIGSGDEVITTPFTFFATAGAISRVGATPVFVDIVPTTSNLDPSLIEEKITKRTKAIIPVHLYGYPAEMDEILKIAKKYNLKVIEDAAQAIGAKYRGDMIGSMGDVGCFSFFPTKNLGCFGDGGMVVTNNSEIADKLKKLRVHGSNTKYNHEILGFNSRLDELQAAILLVKIKHLASWTEKRRTIANLYTSLLKEEISKGDLPITLPFEEENGYHVYHQYTIKTPNRDEIQAYLCNRGIKTTVYYPIPVHLQKVYSKYGYKQGDFPIAEEACDTALSLPMYPELTQEEVIRVVESIVSYYRVGSRQRGGKNGKNLDGKNK